MQEIAKKERIKKITEDLKPSFTHTLNSLSTLIYEKLKEESL